MVAVEELEVETEYDFRQDSTQLVLGLGVLGIVSEIWLPALIGVVEPSS